MRLSPAKQLACLLLVALALRLAAAWWWDVRQGGGFAFGDSLSYWTLARTIAAGEPYEYNGRIFRTPAYPALLAPLFFVGGPHPPVFWGRVVSALCGTAAVAGVWLLARGRFSPPAALAAAAAATVYPGAIALSALVLSEAPFMPLLTAQLALWTAAWQHQRPGRAAGYGLAAGIAAGMATLTRPSWLLFTPWAIGLGAVCFGHRRRQLAVGAAVMAGLVLTMAPWWVRNYHVVGHFVPTTLQVGASLYDGLSPTADGSSNMDFVARFAAEERRDPAGAGGSPSDSFEFRLDQRLRRAAIDWARQNPASALRLAAVKFVRMWGVWPNDRQLSNPVVRLAMAAGYLPAIVLGLIGACATLRRGWPYALCWLPAVYLTLLHVVFVSSIRYREPAMLALIVLAAGWTVEKCLARSGAEAPAAGSSVRSAAKGDSR
jgi:4-amino-4-deoxy-L-arabinose transferase-like glycosyltransferase